MHTFWDTQPIQTINNNDYNGPVIDNSLIEKNNQPYKLPDNFYWHTFNLKDDKELDDLYNFLMNYYAESDDTSLRLGYSKELLKWYLIQPNYIKDLHIGIKYNNKIIATIFGIPTTINVFDKSVLISDINFLCIHKTIRNKRLAPVLIKEIIRRGNLHNIYQGYYTASLDLPNKLTTGTYYHRPINVKKLIEIEHMDKPENISLKALIKQYKPKELTINMRPLEERDINTCLNKFNDYNKKYNIYPILSYEQFKYKFLSNNVIKTLVVENNNKITDFISFYYLSTQIFNHHHFKDVKKAYIYHYFHFETPLKILFDNSLYFLQKDNIDMISCLEQMNNNDLFDKLFHKTSGCLHFYLFNWNCPSININQIAMITV
jgi:glycylpeptide N-tetradecanoyltransferase